MGIGKDGVDLIRNKLSVGFWDRCAFFPRGVESAFGLGCSRPYNSCTVCRCTEVDERDRQKSLSLPCIQYMKIGLSKTALGAMLGAMVPDLADSRLKPDRLEPTEWKVMVFLYSWHSGGGEYELDQSWAPGWGKSPSEYVVQE